MKVSEIDSLILNNWFFELMKIWINDATKYIQNSEANLIKTKEAQYEIESIWNWS